MFQEGLRGTLRIAVISVVASTVIGVVFGTLLTIRFWPTRALIRLYIEVWRGLPIIVTLFMIFFLGPLIADQFEFDPSPPGPSARPPWGAARVPEGRPAAVRPIRPRRTKRPPRPALGGSGSACASAF